MALDEPIFLKLLPDHFRAVIVGASGGIGSAICADLKRHNRIGELVTLSRTVDGFDFADEKSIEIHAARIGSDPIHLLLCATGVLTIDGRPPEKSLKHIAPEIMLEHFAINTVGPALVAKHFLPLLDRDKRSVAAFLSARVGSIGDNRLGGWFSYRAAKAALNQIVRTAAIEMNRSHPKAVITAIHPGTVRTSLSAPYAAGYKTMSATEASRSILTTLDQITSEQTGGFFAYDGSRIEW